MSGEIDVHPEVLRAVARLLRERASSLAGLGSLEPTPDAGASTGELDVLLVRVQTTTDSLARRLTSVAGHVSDSLAGYLAADERVWGLLCELRPGDEP